MVKFECICKLDLVKCKRLDIFLAYGRLCVECPICGFIRMINSEEYLLLTKNN